MTSQGTVATVPYTIADCLGVIKQNLRKLDIASKSAFHDSANFHIVSFFLKAVLDFLCQSHKIIFAEFEIVKIKIFRKTIIFMNDSQCRAAEERQPVGEPGIENDFQNFVLQVFAQDISFKTAQAFRIGLFDLTDANHCLYNLKTC